ncbi:MAG: hypothetical protein DMD74_05320 [Gemmatimonadetes bacterium]|nr:MAG: hypothetical protein DMD74_05320 [Gemmatimonadota bacterium]
MPDLTDRVRRAQDGDETAFRELYDEHAGRIYALCLRLTGDAATAQERTQDAFVRAWERLRSFRGDSAFGTWLHRLAVNVMCGIAVGTSKAQLFRARRLLREMLER